mgnify:CR=1 FL=1
MKPIVQKREQLFQEETTLQRSLSLLFWRPDSELTLSEFARNASISKSSATHAVKWLKRTGFAKVVEKGNVLLISANMENPEYRKRRIAHHLMALYESNFLEYLEESFPHAKAIVLLVEPESQAPLIVRSDELQHGHAVHANAQVRSACALRVKEVEFPTPRST